MKRAVTFLTTESENCRYYSYFVSEGWLLVVNLTFIIAKDNIVLHIIYTHSVLGFEMIMFRTVESV